MDWQLMSVRRILTDHLLFTRTLEHVTDIDTLMNRNSVKIYCFQIDLVFFFWNQNNILHILGWKIVAFW